MTRFAPVLVLAALAAPGMPVLAEEVSRRIEVDPAGQVEISNVAGSVVVTGWNRPEVQVTGELGDGVEKLEFTRQGELTRIRVVLPKVSHRGGSSDLEIRIPARSSLTIGAVSADIKVAGVEGVQRLQTVSGELVTSVGKEDVECKTVSGDLTVNGRGERGLLTLNTVSGDATVTRVAGEINANTVSGELRIEAVQAQRSRLRSTSGDLSLRAALAPGARIDAESISGNVELLLQGETDAEFDVSSFNGDIDNCFGPKASRTDEYAPGRELRFRQGDGSSRVRIKTLNGDIRLCRP
jgi:DUF4097 and DUF4098 domain-containing protein YvlB